MPNYFIIFFIICIMAPIIDFADFMVHINIAGLHWILHFAAPQRIMESDAKLFLSFPFR